MNAIKQLNKIIEERDKLREGIEQLIEYYKAKVKQTENYLQNNSNSGSVFDTEKFSRLKAYKQEHKVFISDLENLLKE